MVRFLKHNTPPEIRAATAIRPEAPSNASHPTGGSGLRCQIMAISDPTRPARKKGMPINRTRQLCRATVFGLMGLWQVGQSEAEGGRIDRGLSPRKISRKPQSLTSSRRRQGARIISSKLCRLMSFHQATRGNGPRGQRGSGMIRRPALGAARPHRERSNSDSATSNQGNAAASSSAAHCAGSSPRSFASMFSFALSSGVVGTFSTS